MNSLKFDVNRTNIKLQTFKHSYFFGAYQESKRFTSFFGVFSMMCVVCIDHSLQVFVPPFRMPANTLVNDDVVKYYIEDPITKNTQTHGDQVGFVRRYRSIIEQCYRRNT